MFDHGRRVSRVVFVSLWFVAPTAATADPGMFLQIWIDDGKKFNIERCGTAFCEKTGRLKHFQYCASNKSLYGGQYCPGVVVFGTVVKPVGTACFGDDSASVTGLVLPAKPILPCFEPAKWDPKKATRCILEVRADGEDLVLHGYCEDGKERTYIENKKRVVFKKGK